MDDLVGWIIVVPVLIVGIALFNCFHSPTHGEHTGYITAVENTGFVFHTWSAYLKTNTQSAQEDRYCVTDTQVLAQLQAAQQNNLQVTVAYDNSLFIPFWECSGKDESVINKVKQKLRQN